MISASSPLSGVEDRSFLLALFHVTEPLTEVNAIYLRSETPGLNTRSGITRCGPDNRACVLEAVAEALRVERKTDTAIARLRLGEPRSVGELAGNGMEKQGQWDRDHDRVPWRGHSSGCGQQPTVWSAVQPPAEGV